MLFLTILLGFLFIWFFIYLIFIPFVAFYWDLWHPQKTLVRRSFCTCCWRQVFLGEGQPSLLKAKAASFPLAAAAGP